ncbi:CBU_0592 family membrane protein [Rhodopila sp.]|uniref:CBU_0592 family membrane protein n=1 Tax=Rhodopila sp. TaxID=2480087 RepID=UPI003D0DFB66
MGRDPYIAAGIAGAGCYVIAYFATLQGWLKVGNWSFPAINLLGALLVLVSLADAWNLPSVLLELFWAAISLYGLLRYWTRRLKRHE